MKNNKKYITLQNWCNIFLEIFEITNKSAYKILSMNDQVEIQAEVNNNQLAVKKAWARPENFNY